MHQLGAESKRRGYRELDKIPTRLLDGFTDTTGSRESELVEMRHMHLAETLITHRNEGGDSVSFCHPLKAG